MRLLVLLAVCCAVIASAQDESGPRPPVVLQHADSLLGAQDMMGPTRTFLGNVRFTQGNVTVVCDRAVHYTDRNRVDLFGHVVITQGALRLTAPEVTYDGNATIATARGGVTLVDSGRTIRSTSGTYHTVTHVATFRDFVRMQDDSLQAWSDTLVYQRDTRLADARGNVLMRTTKGDLWLRGKHAVYDQSAEYMRTTGDARMWRIEEDTVDTLYIAADTIDMWRGDTARLHARTDVRLVRSGLSARGADLLYNDSLGTIDLHGGDPVLWSDSTQLTADSLHMDVPGRSLTSLVGYRNALMVNRMDTTHPDRFDQVSGARITMRFENDSLREMWSYVNARSITFRSDEGEGAGLAQLSSDSIQVEVLGGQVENIRWLGAIHGEHHPEPIVAGRVDTYHLPGFRWITDRPRREPLPSNPAP
jgi:lipopolysaccharide export system protein LptA